MSQQSINIIRLEQIAAGLGELRDKVVFVGGAVVELYLPRPAKIRLRPTNDVDCIIQFTTRIEHARFEESLRKHRFRDAAITIPKAPICRWIYEEILVDFMPTDQAILGFSNRWYPEAVQAKELFRLPSGTEIAICALPYFLATKLEAFKDRGAKDPRASTDLEDIVTLIDGVADLETKLLKSAEPVKLYLKEEFARLSSDKDFVEGIECNAVLGFEQAERVRERLKHLSASL